MMIECFGLIGLSSFGEGWAVTFAAIGIECKLRNKKNASLNILNRAVCFTCFILKYAQFAYFGHEFLCDCGGIFGANTKQDN